MGLEAEPGMPSISAPALPCEVSIKLITGIKLHPRLSGEDSHCSSTERIENVRGPAEGTCIRRAQAEGVVVASGAPELRMVTTDGCTKRPWLAEIKGCSRYRCFFTGRNQAFIHWKVGIGIKGEKVVQAVARVVAPEIKVGVVRYAERCRGGGPGLILNA